MLVETNKIKLVDLRVYRKELGVEVDDEMPKALVYLNQNDGKYHNLLEKEVRNYLVRQSLDMIVKNDLEEVYLTTNFINGTSTLQSNIFSSEQVLVNRETNNYYFNEGNDVSNQYYLL